MPQIFSRLPGDDNHNFSFIQMTFYVYYYLCKPLNSSLSPIPGFIIVSSTNPRLSTQKKKPVHKLCDTSNYQCCNAFLLRPYINLHCHTCLSTKRHPNG